MDPVWLLGLLPLAAGSGWLAAQSRAQIKPARERLDLSDAYFQGLNYLLNEQPDKAIEAFLKVLEVDSDTVEMHLAIGNLFRRRGEIERATRLHQNLIARPKLDPAHRIQGIYELAQDYQKAGLLDRAESLFKELLSHSTHAELAASHLIQIYEQEREWLHCIAITRRYLSADGSHYIATVLAQYYCELAEEALADGRYERATSDAQQSLLSDPNCIRATMLTGRIAANLGDHQQALEVWKNIVNQDPDFAGEVVELMRASFSMTKNIDGFRTWLTEILSFSGDPRVLLAYMDCNENAVAHQANDDSIAHWLQTNPSLTGLHRFVQLKAKRATPPQSEEFRTLENIVGQLVDIRSSYECVSCGFRGRLLHWQCPGCRRWSTLFPKLQSRKSLTKPQIQPSLAAPAESASVVD